MEIPSYREVFLFPEVQTADVVWADFCCFFNRIVHFSRPRLLSCAEGTFRHLADLIARGRSAVTIGRSERKGQALPQKSKVTNDDGVAAAKPRGSWPCRSDLFA